MNPSPRKRWDGWEGDPTYNPGCGILAMQNVDRARWQSLFNLREPPQLSEFTDIHNLAALLRVRQPDSSEPQ